MLKKLDITEKLENSVKKGSTQKSQPTELYLTAQISPSFSPYQDYLSCADLWLRPIFPSDYKPMLACYADPESMRYWRSGTTFNRTETQDLMLQHANRNIFYTDPKGNAYHNVTCGWSIITEKGVSGSFFAWQMSAHEVEIGYLRCPRFAGVKGLTALAGQLIVNHKFSHSKFSGTLYATAHPQNIPSQKILRKLGLKADPKRQNVAHYNSVRNYYQLVVLEESCSDIHHPKQRLNAISNSIKLHADPLLFSMGKTASPLELILEYDRHIPCSL